VTFINPDKKKEGGEHMHRFNAPVVDDVDGNEKL